MRGRRALQRGRLAALDGTSYSRPDHSSEDAPRNPAQRASSSGSRWKVFPHAQRFD
jgi:hypothetical protein